MKGLRLLSALTSLTQSSNLLGVLSLATLVFAIFQASWRRIKSTLTYHYTALDDLPCLERSSRPESDKILGTVVIAGGSIAGLLTAQICSRHFERVLIVDPETTVNSISSLDISAGDTYRRRIPQRLSLHAFPALTHRLVTTLFPNWRRLVEKAGGRIGSCDLRVPAYGAPYHCYPVGHFPQTTFLSRPGFETVLRYAALNSSREMPQITSVKIKAHEHPGIEQPCVMLVDCSGAAQSGLKWLSRAGFLSSGLLAEDQDGATAASLRESYDPQMNYVTGHFPSSGLPTKPRDYQTDTAALFMHVSLSCDDNKTVLATTVEDDQVQIALGGWGPSVPRPTSALEFHDFCTKVQMPRSHAIPTWFLSMLSSLHNHPDADKWIYSSCRAAPSSLIHYRHVQRIPTNFFAIGDSFMRLNPAFGQGTGKAAIEILTLAGLLDADRQLSYLASNLNKRFFKLQYSRTKGVWDATKAWDYGFETTQPVPGETLKVGSLRRQAVRLFLDMAWKDPQLMSFIWHSHNFLDYPTDILTCICRPIFWYRLVTTLIRR